MGRLTEASRLLNEARSKLGADGTLGIRVLLDMALIELGKLIRDGRGA